MATTIDPANILVGIGSLFVDGVNVGATFDGINIEKTMEHFFHEVDQFLDAVGATPTNMQLVVTTNLVEMTLSNIKLIWNERNVPAGGVLRIGIDPDPKEHVIRFEGRKPGPGAIGSRQYEMFRAFSVDASEQALKKDDKTMLPTTFRCLPDVCQAVGEEYGTITDI